MNRAFDYNGTIVSPSKPTTNLTTLRRVVHLDSGDRDFSQYPTNGDMVLYLPRTYEKVVGIRVKGAEFPPFTTSSTIGSTGTSGAFGSITILDPAGNPILQGSVFSRPGYYVHDYSSGITTGLDYPLTGTVTSIFLDIENLNRADETAPQHDRSSFTDSTFAKFQTNPNTLEYTVHNESSSMHAETYYTPPIGKLDRLHLTLRTHKQRAARTRTGLTGGPGFIYSSGGTYGTTGPEYGLTLEIITLENSFDEYSSMETRITNKQPEFWSSN
jgi:hypothetical protein